MNTSWGVRRTNDWTDMGLMVLSFFLEEKERFNVEDCVVQEFRDEMKGHRKGQAQ